MKLFLTIAICLSLVTTRAQAQCTYADPNIGKPTTGYGADGTHTMTVDSMPNSAFPGQYIRVYHPADITGPVPTIFYSHAYGGYNPINICGLYTFAAKKGYAFVFVPYQTVGVTVADRYANLLAGFRLAARTWTGTIDTTKTGFLGWSFGGGASFATAYTCFTENNWGSAGRFIYALAQWYSYNISQSQLQAFPANTKLLTEIFDNDSTNDHRMAIDIFNNISIPNSDKDFLLLQSDTLSGYVYDANHMVPNTVVFDAYDYYAYYRLLDALCDYTFNGNTAGRDVALGGGSTAQVTMPGGLKPLIESDNPMADSNTFLYPQARYQYPCDDTQNPRIDYCSPTVTGIAASTVAPGVQVYPNPATDIITIITPPATTGYIYLDDATGRLLGQWPAAGQHSISLSGYAPGLYIVAVGDERKKVVKQ